MSYQEKRSIVSFVSTLLISLLYGWYMWGQLPQGDPYAPELFVFWGKFFVLLLIVTSLLQIFGAISVGLFKGLAAGVNGKAQDPDLTDERDEMVDLKASRIGLYLFAAGVMLGMALLWAGQPPTVLFVTLFLGGLLSSLAVDVAQFLYYRGGVYFG